ncbi:MAG: DNA polymerase IV [Pseudomonadota bacterium]
MGVAQTPERAILHVDMDAFYASVEQRDRPELRGKPLVVGGTTNRGVVAAASYEARRFGVRSAMPIRQALERCAELVRVPVRMARYREVSSQVFAIFHEHASQVQGLSLDEAYLDVTEAVTTSNIETIGKLIKDQIKARTALTASVGMAHNMLLAKIASDLDKPDGFVHIRPEEASQVLAELPVRRLAGIGPRTADRLKEIGIDTLAQLHAASEARLRPVLGNHARVVRDRAVGIDHRQVVSDREDRSVSAEDTFERNITAPAGLHEELTVLTARVVERLNAKGLRGALVRVKIRRRDFTTLTRQRRIAPPTDDGSSLLAVAQELLDEWIASEPQFSVRLLGVGVGELQQRDQLDLFGA